MRQIHNSRKRGVRCELLSEADRKMPAILRKEEQDAWLAGTKEEAWTALQPYPSESMVAWPGMG